MLGMQNRQVGYFWIFFNLTNDRDRIFMVNVNVNPSKFLKSIESS